MSTKRISKELSELTANPPDGTTISLPDESNMYSWHIIFKGPSNTPFAGGTFNLTLTLPQEYPFKPPTLSFTTKIYHPNVSNDGRGNMCLGLLRPDSWKPNSKISDVLKFAMHLLKEPDPDDAVEQGIAAEFKEKKGEWEKTAKRWTKEYAGEKQVAVVTT